MLRIVPHTVPRVGRSYEHFPDGFELHLLPVSGRGGAPASGAHNLEPLLLQVGVSRRNGAALFPEMGVFAPPSPFPKNV